MHRLLSPFLIREFVSVLGAGSYLPNDPQAYSTFGFIYGMFPTAPTVFIYAQLYNMQAPMVRSYPAKISQQNM